MLAKAKTSQKKDKCFSKILCKEEKVLLVRIKRSHSYEETNTWNYWPQMFGNNQKM